jgi:hypothetical protein
MGSPESIFAATRGTVMADFISRLPELIEQGNEFTYENFASRTPRGYPSALSEDWLVWTHLVTGLVEELDKSPIRDSITLGLRTVLIGNGEDSFQAARGSMLSGLRAAQKVFGKPVPASDRTVSLGHNSPEQTQVLEKIDELVAAVERTNDFPGDSDDKELVVAELSAGRRLLQAANVRVAAVREVLQPALRWILEKSAGAAIGKLAGDLLEYLVHLKFW